MTVQALRTLFDGGTSVFHFSYGGGLQGVSAGPPSKNVNLRIRQSVAAVRRDLAGEFRPLLADSCVLTLINNREISGSDFVIRAGAVTLEVVTDLPGAARTRPPGSSYVVTSGLGGVDASRGCLPAHDAWFRLAELPTGGQLAPLVTTTRAR